MMKIFYTLFSCQRKILSRHYTKQNLLINAGSSAILLICKFIHRFSTKLLQLVQLFSEKSIMLGKIKRSLLIYLPGPQIIWGLTLFSYSVKLIHSIFTMNTLYCIINILDLFTTMPIVPNYIQLKCNN